MGNAFDRQPAPPADPGPSDAVLLLAMNAEMARVRVRLTRLMGKDPAERPGPTPVVLQFPRPHGAPVKRRFGITVAPGWGERRRDV